MVESNDYILKVSNLTVKLQNEIILENVHFKIKKGTILAIVGPNGAGKTMLFRSLLNLIPHTGNIEWDEKVKIGYVPQNISVRDIPISVKEFLSYGKNVNIKELLASVKLNEPGLMNKTLSILSGGQLRRVLVAWALLDNPSVLLFDLLRRIGIIFTKYYSLFSGATFFFSANFTTNILTSYKNIKGIAINI